MQDRGPIWLRQARGHLRPTWPRVPPCGGLPVRTACVSRARYRGACAGRVVAGRVGWPGQGRCEGFSGPFRACQRHRRRPGSKPQRAGGGPRAGPGEGRICLLLGLAAGLLRLPQHRLNVKPSEWAIGWLIQYLYYSQQVPGPLDSILASMVGGRQEPSLRRESRAICKVSRCRGLTGIGPSLTVQPIAVHRHSVANRQTASVAQGSKAHSPSSQPARNGPSP